MSEPSNGPRPRPRGARRGSHRRHLLDAIEILCRSDRRVPVALVTILRYGDARSLRAVRVILGLALRAARRDRRQVTIYVTTESRRSR